MRQVSPYNTKLDKHNAYWMARIAEAVYECTSDCDQLPNEATILAGLKKDDRSFRSVMGVDKNSAQAALIEHEDYLCMAFRGTNELADWLDNLNAFSTPQLFGEFHRGFWLCCEDVWGPMFTRCLELQSQKKRPVFLTGHSLGGAMATIAAAHFVQMDKPFTSVYTFGQPRAMTRETAQVFNMECKSRFYRFHNNNDIVTRVPARVMGYSHIGSYLYISEEKEIYRESGFWFRFLDYVDGALSDLREAGIDGIKDHDMGEYLQAIEAWDIRD
ncbi:MAG: lipase [Oceanospirillaceae bacterium]|jgi:predicted lipase|nr:lipase [Oceanospirillaceae bacterium]MAE35768.1 lipase [Oceanospirillaceae bacterium]MDQ4423277.1 lipase family protein [Thalassolituus sp.]OUX65764.1 MAG: lipase [Oceanospirillaceae bacterium TMED276]|tara:strand:+ start:5355 stop:6170 length:816 start_codon:yes stop_codon:yes gene_type:complete